jgi:hypothetical protein
MIVIYFIFFFFISAKALMNVLGLPVGIAGFLSIFCGGWLALSLDRFYKDK